MSGGQCLFDRGHEGLFVVVAEIALDDAALLVDQEGRGRQAHVAEGLRDLALGVDDHGERQLARFGEILDVVGRVVLHGHADGVEAPGFQFLVVADGVGHLRHAGGAAGGPELDQHDLAAQVAGGDRMAVQVGEGDVGRRLRGALELPEGGDGDRRDGHQAKDGLFHCTGMVWAPPSPPAGGVAEVPDESLESLTGALPCWPGSVSRLSRATIVNNFTTLLTPEIPAATVAARRPSSSVTLPIRWTAPRSVVTLMVRKGTFSVATSWLLTLDVSQVSLVRTLSGVMSPTRMWLSTVRTLVMPRAMVSACCRSASVGTSPTSSSRPA